MYDGETAIGEVWFEIAQNIDEKTYAGIARAIYRNKLRQAA